jgi:sugar/nucleoside kinase (ribokinase family)
MLRILVVGGASLDTLHFAGQTQESIGGAGIYTALAAHRCGVEVTIFAPKPDPVPAALRPVFERLTWQGPLVRPAELPRFEYAYEGEGTSVLQAFFGAETRLAPDMLPPDLSPYDVVHVIPLGSSSRQLSFLQACRKHGAKRLSAGTFNQGILDDSAATRDVLSEADLFFLNRQEAMTLFGSVEAARTEPGKLMFVTLGAQGTWVIQGEYKTHVPAIPVQVLDPTGAGDAFCGAMIARLALGYHPVQAARLAMPLAAHVVSGVGPAVLLVAEPIPSPPPDGRVVVNEAQVQRVASLIAGLPEVRPFDFTGPEFPPAGHPAALDFFFSVILQQFGFWSMEDGRYHEPLIAAIWGQQRKGSSFMFQAYRHLLEKDPGFFTPKRQAKTTQAEFSSVLRTDDGQEVMPAFDLHLAQARAYGRDMLALNLTPSSILAQAAGSPTPLRTFLSWLDQVAGYKEDPFRKKSTLLALVLNQRPETFLPFGPGEQPTPVIDYHLMRSCLRVGLIDVQDEHLARLLSERKLVEPTGELAVRQAAYQAIAQIVARSGKSMGAVDWFFFNARRRCPEMTEPECQLCALDPLCAHRKELFQPVLRTTFY